MLRRAALLVLLCLLTACSAGPPAGGPAPDAQVATTVDAPTDAPTDTPTGASRTDSGRGVPPGPLAAPRPSATPTPAGTPVPSPAPPPRLEPVAALLPEVRVDAPGPLPGDAATRAMEVPGVAFATAVAIEEVPVTLADGRTGRLRMAAVDPLAYRVLVPQVTADSDPVWARLAAGDLVGTHELATAHGVELGSRLETPAGPMRLSVLASLGQPAVAGAVVDGRLAPRLGLGAPSTLLVAVHPDSWPDEVAAALSAALGLEAQLIYGVPQRPQDAVPADASVWDALALCESSGRWGIDSGNGYYGGLQFLPSSWQLVGGSGLPHEASREEQIHRAELLLARQGWKAWPVCSVKLGLREPEPDEQHLHAAAP